MTPTLPVWDFKTGRDLRSNTDRWIERLAETKADGFASLWIVACITPTGTFVDAFLRREEPLECRTPGIRGLRNLYEVSVRGAVSEEAAVQAVEQAAVTAGIFRKREDDPSPRPT